MDKRLLAVLALVIALASGCDWIRAKLDMPTSEDIAKKKELIALKEAAVKASVPSDTLKADSLQMADTTAVTSIAEANPEPSASGLALTPRSSLDKTYYIIVGAFKTDELVSLSLKENEGILDTPFAFAGNGLKYVAIGGYNTLEEARRALYEAHKKAPEAWVWKKNN